MVLELDLVGGLHAGMRSHVKEGVKRCDIHINLTV